MTGEHITEVISQRGKIADYIHEENMQEHERFKMLQTNTLVQLVVLLVFGVIILVLIAFVDKSYLPQALTLIFGFIGGFGLGRTFKDTTSKKE